MNFLELAKHRFPDSKILGSGRWTISTPNNGVITLHETREAAERQILDHRYATIVDLQPLNLDRMPDRYYDREEARRERREKQA